MITPELYFLLAAVAAVPGLLALAGGLLLGRRLRAAQHRLAELESTVAMSAQSYEGLSAGAVGQGESLARMEQNMARLRQRLEQLTATTEGGGASFNQAIRMARKGCSAGEIMETCGLTQVEADLVVLLHREGG